MPETAQSCGTAELMRLLNTKLRKDAIELRALAAAGGDTAADEMLAELFKALCICTLVDRFLVDHGPRGRDLTGGCL